MAMTKLQPVRGTHDILPEEAQRRYALYQVVRGVMLRYGFGEVQTPVFEFSEVFHRTLGGTSDIVSKETYDFTDRGGEGLTLRPEFTASVVRAFISAGLQQELPVKWHYYGPAFRYERPQKGRQRQFHQYGAELLGVAEPEADVEIIALGWDILSAIGIANNVTLEINSLGDAESRNAYRAALVSYFTSHRDALSEDSRVRLEKNPLRILDSKDAGDRALIGEAPKAVEYFTPEANAFFARVQEGISRLSIPFTVNPTIVRGLDYYQHTVFEFIAREGLGTQNTVLAGGRYDGLVEQMGGPSIPGVGFGAGVERLLLAGIDWSRIPGAQVPAPVAVIPIGEACEQAAWSLTHALRGQGFVVDMAYKGNAGKRMKRADKLGARAALMLGEEELAAGCAALKDLKTGEQARVPMDGIAQALRDMGY